mgnify:CR=1 FL=1
MTSTPKLVRTENFRNEEFACPCCNKNDIKLVVLACLQEVREDFGRPIKITSGYRCYNHNKAVGGSPSSSHVKGLAADIKVEDSDYAFRIMKSIFATDKFYRIGYGKMNGVLTLHVDLDENKLQHVLWGY